MERFAQYLDDLEDLYFAIGLQAEKIRRAACLCLILLGSAVLQIAAVALALHEPPLALALICLAVVGLLCRGVTTVPNRRPQVLNALS